MIWTTNWWGIIVRAENDEDAAILQSLYTALPEKAYDPHNRGVVELVEVDEHLHLIFER